MKPFLTKFFISTREGILSEIIKIMPYRKDGRGWVGWYPGGVKYRAHYDVNNETLLPLIFTHQAFLGLDNAGKTSLVQMLSTGVFHQVFTTTFLRFSKKALNELPEN